MKLGDQSAGHLRRAAPPNAPPAWWRVGLKSMPQFLSYTISSFFWWTHLYRIISKTCASVKLPHAACQGPSRIVWEQLTPQMFISETQNVMRSWQFDPASVSCIPPGVAVLGLQGTMPLLRKLVHTSAQTLPFSPHSKLLSQLVGFKHV